MLNGIVIDDEIQCRNANATAKTMQNEVLEPDARMEQIRLVPGNDQRIRADVGKRFAAPPLDTLGQRPQSRRWLGGETQREAGQKR